MAPRGDAKPRDITPVTEYLQLQAGSDTSLKRMCAHCNLAYAEVEGSYERTSKASVYSLKKGRAGHDGDPAWRLKG